MLNNIVTLNKIKLINNSNIVAAVLGFAPSPVSKIADCDRSASHEVESTPTTPSQPQQSTGISLLYLIIFIYNYLDIPCHPQNLWPRTNLYI